MKHYKTVVVPETTREQYITTECDLCGDLSVDEWAGNYSAFDATVTMREGTSYPEGGYGTEVTYDICPTCFKEKLIPWLEGEGAKTEAREWEF